MSFVSLQTIYNILIQILYFNMSFMAYIVRDAHSIAARSKSWVCGRTLAEITGSNTVGDMAVCLLCCVFSGAGLCDGLILVHLPSVVCPCVI